MLQLWLVDCVAVGHETDPVSNNGPRMLLLDLTHEILCRLFLVGFRKREKAEGTACTIWYLVPLHDESDNSFVSRKPSLFFFVEKVSVFTIYFLVSRPQSAVKKRKSFQFLFLFQVVANVLLCAESVECPSISSALTRSRNAGPFDAKGHTHTKKKKVRLIDVFFFFYIIAEGCARMIKLVR